MMNDTEVLKKCGAIFKIAQRPSTDQCEHEEMIAPLLDDADLDELKAAARNPDAHMIAGPRCIADAVYEVTIVDMFSTEFGDALNEATQLDDITDVYWYCEQHGEAQYEGFLGDHAECGDAE